LSKVKNPTVKKSGWTLELLEGFADIYADDKITEIKGEILKFSCFSNATTS
jgi:hypothetical protein